MYIITKPFMGGSNFKQQMLNWARTAVSKRHQRVRATTQEAQRLAQEELANAHHTLAEYQAEAGVCDPGWAELVIKLHALADFQAEAGEHDLAGLSLLYISTPWQSSRRKQVSMV